MGTTGAHGVEVANSYARRTGDDVFLQLHLPESDGVEEPVLRLKRIGKGPARRLDTTAVAAAAAEGVMITATVPAAEVGVGLWQVRMQAKDEDSFRGVRARLLVDPKQPIALLAGPVPDTRMTPPRPRRRPQGNAAPAPTGYKARLRRVARRLKPSR